MCYLFSIYTLVIVVGHILEIILSVSIPNLQSAQAISKLSEVLGESLSSHYHVLLQSLMKEIPGRLWEVRIFIHDLW